MHFGLLGPLEVVYDGERLDLGRPKQRVVLAALLARANQVVSLDRFAEVLWPAAPAGRSMGSLPVYIANLRRLLEPDRPMRTPPGRIVTHPPGYLLRIAPGEYDAADFEALAAQGNRHLADGRPRAARRRARRGPRAVAGPGHGGVRVRPAGGRPAGGPPGGGAGGPDRGRPGPGGPHRGGERARGPGQGTRAQGTPGGPPDGRPVPLGPPGGGAAGLHRGSGLPR